jgi:superfamily II DNA helicase RecQ
MWFRAPTTRRNIGYRVERYDEQEETEGQVVMRVVEAMKDKYQQDKGQTIVYCDTVERVKRHGRMLGAVCYHREAGSEEEKRQMVQALRKGQQQVFTATNALGLGVDAAGVRAVIHIGVVRLVRDYVQESGRAGRDGSRSEAIIIRPKRAPYRAKDEGD